MGRLSDRTDLLRKLDLERRDLERSATFERYDRHRQSAISLLASAEREAGLRRDQGRREDARPLWAQ